MTTRASAVLDFSGLQTAVATGKFVLDWDKNRGVDGKEKPQFRPGDTVFMLFQPAKDAQFTDKKSSLRSGVWQNLGRVTRTVVEQIQFTDQKKIHTVQYRPSSNTATATFFSKTPRLTVNSGDGTITASGELPAIGTLSYQSQFISLSFRAAGEVAAALEAEQARLGQDEQAVYNVLNVAYDDAVG